MQLWVLFLIAPMATKDKNTPKKLYTKQKESKVESRCRLCNRITDPGHSKNIFRVQNQAILHNAEIFYGANLPQDSNLPHLICAPCERRLKNVTEFKKVITDTQRELQENLRTKCCVEISLTVGKSTCGWDKSTQYRLQPCARPISNGSKESCKSCKYNSIELQLYFIYNCWLHL